MPRGQFSIDFFLVLSVILAFLVPLYSVAVDEGGRARFLDSAVLAKHAVDSVSSLVDFVSLSGPSSSASGEVFIPKEANCFFFNSTSSRLYCTMASRYLEGSRNRVESQRLALSTIISFNCGSNGVLSPGWYDITANYSSSIITVQCLKVS